MLNKKHGPVATLFILLTLTAISEPAKALSIAQDSEATSSDSSELTQEGHKNPDTNFKEHESGSVNPDFNDSGQIDFDIEGSGEVNTDLREESGTVNPDFDDSGTVDPDFEDSGQLHSLNNSRLYSQASPEVDNDAIAPNEIEEASDDRGSWWWWLPLIIGIPLIAAILVSTIGGKRSDREPAIDRVPDPNDPNGGIGLSGAAGVEDLSTVGANTSNLNNTVASSTTSNVGEMGVTSGTALAGRGSSLVDDLARTNDDIDLEPGARETEPVTEIPSNSVSEFTGQETKLQVTDSGTKLQDNIEDISSEPFDSVPPSSTMSGFVAERQIEETETPFVEDAATYTQPDVEDIDIARSSVDPSVDTNESIEGFTSDSTIEADTAIETNEAKEFRGDYVLDEETITSTPNEPLSEGIDRSYRESNVIQSSDRMVDELNVIDDSTTTELERTTSEPEAFSSEIDIDTSDEELIVETTQSNFDIAQNINSLEDAAVTNAAASEFLVSESDSQSLVNIDIDEESQLIANEQQAINAESTDEELIVETTQTDSNTIDIEQPEELQESINSDIAPETTSDVFVSDRQTDFNDLNLSIDEIGFDDAERFDLDEIGFNRNSEITDASLNEIVLDNEVETIDASIDEIGFDDLEDSDLDGISFDDVETIDADLDQISFENTDTDAQDEISFNDVETIDADLDQISFENTDTDALDEISFDDDETINASLDEISLEDVETTDADLDQISFGNTDTDALDEISFDDDETINASLDEISLDNTNDSDLVNISFDESNDSNRDEIISEELSQTRDDATLDSLSNNTAGISSLSNDESEDLDNISEWLNSLETPTQSTDNILEWLDSLNTNDTDSVREDSDRENNSQTNEENDVSFQFIEDLLERGDTNQDDK